MLIISSIYHMFLARLLTSVDTTVDRRGLVALSSSQRDATADQPANSEWRVPGPEC